MSKEMELDAWNEVRKAARELSPSLGIGDLLNAVARYGDAVRAHALDEAASVAEKTFEGEDNGLALYGTESASAIRALKEKP